MALSWHFQPNRAPHTAGSWHVHGILSSKLLQNCHVCFIMRVSFSFYLIFIADLEFVKVFVFFL